MRTLIASIATLLTLAVLGNGAEDQNAMDRLLNRIVEQEQQFTKEMSGRTPLLETYIQETSEESGGRAVQDHYFLGRLSMTSGVEYTPIASRTATPKGTRLSFIKHKAIIFVPAGFAQMIFIDTQGFDRSHYKFEYVRREFLGEVRCLVFDVVPLDVKAEGRFIGRVWIEDKGLHIVRFNGTYTKPTARRLYFHFDSWRVAVNPDLWVPLCTYVEESSVPGELKAVKGATFKAQTRLWGYNSGKTARLDELTNILVEMDAPVRDKDASADTSPLESQRSWERQSEENILDRLQKIGLIAPKGSVDEVLNTVVNNLIATNGLNVEAQCRVLMTTPLETFAVGHTIVISRGLIDVLPDEASLAMVLSDELAHIALGHRTNTQFAFNNQTMFSDEEILQRFRFSRTGDEIAAAGKKAVEMLRNSPYNDKLANAGLFLKALASRAPEFPNLIRANIGNRLANGDTLARMADLTLEAPKLDDNKLEQIAALPLGSRIKVEPWTDTVTMIKAKPVSLLSAREKLSFEVTPFMLYLTRARAAAAQTSMLQGTPDSQGQP